MSRLEQPKMILICGKICSGKTTYTKKLIKEIGAVHLSCDEITLALFGGQIGEKHQEMVANTINYLFNKSLEILDIGVSVVLDIGFWQKSERDEATAFYSEHGIVPEWHYIDVLDDVWKSSIEKRNADIKNGKANEYYIDDNISKMFSELFETPTKDEMDVWITNDWS